MLKMVGTTRFELTTSSTPRKRSTKLSYVPNTWYYTDLFIFCQSLCVICFMSRRAPISTPVSRATCSIVRPARKSARALIIDSSSRAGGSASSTTGGEAVVCTDIGAGASWRKTGSASRRETGAADRFGCATAVCICGDTVCGMRPHTPDRVCSRRMEA